MSCSRVGGAPIRGGGACCPHLFSPGPSTWFWVSHRPALPPFLYALCVHRLCLRLNLSSLCLALFQSSRISLACLSPFLSVSFCLCDSFHQLLQFSPLSCISIPLSPPYHLPTLSSLPLSLCPLTNLPSPLPAATAPLLSRPFSLRIFCSPPFHPHCLSQIPLFPCGAGSSQ